jgi:hypothetical protein
LQSWRKHGEESKTAKNSDGTAIILAVFQIAERSAARNAAEEEMSIADKSVRKQQKQPNPAARPPMLCSL